MDGLLARGIGRKQYLPLRLKHPATVDRREVRPAETLRRNLTSRGRNESVFAEPA
jgi:hypothetical protein